MKVIHAVPVEPIPNILTGDAAKGYATGYAFFLVRVVVLIRHSA
ncbi:MAG: hypothetical protein V8T12_03630 [Parabacteroides johnsonii]